MTNATNGLSTPIASGRASQIGIMAATLLTCATPGYVLAQDVDSLISVDAERVRQYYDSLPQSERTALYSVVLSEVRGQVARFWGPAEAWAELCSTTVEVERLPIVVTTNFRGLGQVGANPYRLAQDILQQAVASGDIDGFRNSGPIQRSDSAEMPLPMVVTLSLPQPTAEGVAVSLGMHRARGCANDPASGAFGAQLRMDMVRRGGAWLFRGSRLLWIT